MADGSRWCRAARKQRHSGIREIYRRVAAGADRRPGAWARLGPNGGTSPASIRRRDLPFLLGFLSDRNGPGPVPIGSSARAATSSTRNAAWARRPSSPTARRSSYGTGRRHTTVGGGGRSAAGSPPPDAEMHAATCSRSRAKACLLTRDSIEAEAHGGVAPEVAQAARAAIALTAATSSGLRPRPIMRFSAAPPPRRCSSRAVVLAGGSGAPRARCAALLRSRPHRGDSVLRPRPRRRATVAARGNSQLLSRSADSARGLRRPSHSALRAHDERPRLPGTRPYVRSKRRSEAFVDPCDGRRRVGCAVSMAENTDPDAGAAR